MLVLVQIAQSNAPMLVLVQIAQSDAPMHILHDEQQFITILVTIHKGCNAQ